jgi:hypothetical protein
MLSKFVLNPKKYEEVCHGKNYKPDEPNPPVPEPKEVSKIWFYLDIVLIAMILILTIAFLVKLFSSKNDDFLEVNYEDGQEEINIDKAYSKL